MPGATSVTRIAVGEQLEAQRLRDRVGGVLGGRVAAAALVDLDPGDRADDHDRAAPSRARSAGSSAFVTRITPGDVRLPHLRASCSSSASAIGSSPSAPPALWTITSTLGSSSASAADRVRIGDVELAAPARRPPRRAASQRSSRRAAATVSKPAAASARTVAAPIPLEAPVTSAIRRSLNGSASGAETRSTSSVLRRDLARAERHPVPALAREGLGVVGGVRRGLVLGLRRR